MFERRSALWRGHSHGAFCKGQTYRIDDVNLCAVCRYDLQERFHRILSRQHALRHPAVHSGGPSGDCCAISQFASGALGLSRLDRLARNVPVIYAWVCPAHLSYGMTHL